MTPEEKPFDWEDILRRLEPPLLILSTKVGRGMYYLGEALLQRLAPDTPAHHRAIEEFLPPSALAEDVTRYRLISTYCPRLLHLVYRVPLFYQRKYWRERLWRATDLSLLQKALAESGVRTVLCVSHRAAFWASALKRQAGLKVALWDLLGEYGMNLGYRYIFWDQMDGFLSAVDRSTLSIRFPGQVSFCRVTLPARKEFYQLAESPGYPHKVLVMCGYWGQGPLLRVLTPLLRGCPEVEFTVVCGENEDLRRKLHRHFHANARVQLLGAVPSLAPYLKEAGAVISKPGISTLLEAWAAKRKIFLIKGMPVAEDNNARHAIRHFGAEWLTVSGFERWQRKAGGVKERLR